LRPLPLVPDGTAIPFMRGRFAGVITSAVLSVMSVILFFYPGLNFGVDFRGGVVVELRGPQALPAGLDLEGQVRKDDEQEHRKVEPANSILLRPAIALVAPRDGLAAGHMSLDRFSLSNIACVFQQCRVNPPAEHTRLQRRTKAECRICRPVIAVI
jgi:hypothetical protein